MNKHNKRLKWVCVGLALALALSAAGLYLLRNSDSPTRNQLVAEKMQSVQAKLSFGGAEAVLKGDQTDAASWLGSPDGTLMVLEMFGDTLVSAIEDFHTDGVLPRFVTSPYFHDRHGPMGDYDYAALALLLGDDGQILRRFFLIADPAYAEMPPSLGRDDPDYATYFPKLNLAMYEAYWAYLEDGSIAGAWDTTEYAASWPYEGRVAREAWMDNDDVLRALASGATQADVDAVKRYYEWEREQFQKAGDWCAQLVQSDDGSLYALALYQNNAETNAGYLEAIRRLDLAIHLFPFWMLGFILLTLLMAFWVLLDARGRDFKPALWGILTLLGNVGALIVYLIVRPADARCGKCGAPVRRDYVACPMCGDRLRNRCPSCGRAQEDAWILCPYCGTGLGGEAEKPPVSP